MKELKFLSRSLDKNGNRFPFFAVKMNMHLLLIYRQQKEPIIIKEKCSCVSASGYKLTFFENKKLLLDLFKVTFIK